jgi:hypothetical protein
MGKTVYFAISIPLALWMVLGSYSESIRWHSIVYIRPFFLSNTSAKICHASAGSGLKIVLQLTNSLFSYHFLEGLAII